MASTKSRNLVIDACVAQATGETRDFLGSMKDKTPHKLVMTKDIGSEWDRHASRWTRKWRVSMEARRRIYRPHIYSENSLCSKIEQNTSDEYRLREMLKDVHILDAAIATDECIVSLDNKARGLFASASNDIGELRNVVWVNPIEENMMDPIEWLLNGAEAEAICSLQNVK